ncbi:unnamed protein product [Moneuplotes crassus]|uniref:Endonuclease/exonuclease/phosphatase domain-containing protein n=1 Tax=Euplotes crassus TaxID=5936 RepID=A0AAD1U035_EUPCR|nr:unnamed protein product [Moneuplotes crassus]
MESTSEHIEYFTSSRKWVPNFTPESTKESFSGVHNSRISLMSYNVLADSYLGHVDYGDVDPCVLDWSYRYKLIQAEIEHLDPDIICMQELEDEVLTEALSNKLVDGKIIPNYASTFIYKIDKNDCVCIFWKTSKFESLGSWCIEFNNPRARSHLYCKQHVASFAALKLKNHPKKRIILVATTHILYNTGRGDIKLAQLDLATKSLAMIKNHLTKKYKNYDISTILCGDFNSVSRSGLYQYLSEGEYDCSSQNRDEISGQRHEFTHDEDGYKSCIQKLQPNPEAEPLKLPYWFLEINNTSVFVRNPYDDNVFIEFGIQCDFLLMLETCKSIENDLELLYTQSHKRAILDQADDSDDEIDWAAESKEDEATPIDPKDIPQHEFILRNLAGKFKSVYPRAMDILEAVLFEESQTTSSKEDLSRLEKLGANSQEIREKYNEGDTIFGAFKPNFHDKEEFEQYFSGTTKELAFTSYFEEKLLLDYIWYQGAHIDVIRVLDMPCFYTDLARFEGAPNELIPSDHLPIMAEFYID